MVPMQDIPASAAPVLSYRRQEPNDDLRWILRWVGAWMMVQGGARAVLIRPGAISSLLSLFFSGDFRLLATLGKEPIGGMLFLAVGVGIVKRRRVAMYSAVALLGLDVATSWLFYSAIPGLSWLRLALATAQGSVQTIVSLLIVLSVLRRAERQTMLLPRGRESSQPAIVGRHLRFFMQRVAWYWMSFALHATVGLIALTVTSSPILPGPRVYEVSSIISAGLLALSGLVLYWRYRAALLCIIGVSIVTALAQPWLAAQLTSGSSRPIDFTYLCYTAPAVIGSSVMLFLLYRRLGRAERFETDKSVSPQEQP